VFKNGLSLSALEEENGDLAKVEVNKVLRLVSHVRAKVASNDAMPCWVVLLVELFLDVSSDVFLDVVLLKSLKRFD
jgi:hypothetical protein